jgi:hypothetical protein
VVSAEICSWVFPLPLVSYLIHIKASSPIQPVNIRRSFDFVPKMWYFLLTIYYRTQTFRINFMRFSCLKSGFSWLPSLDLLSTISLLMELFHIPLSVPKTRFMVTSLHLALCVTDRDGFLLTRYRGPVSWDRPVSPQVERNQPYICESISYFAFRQLTTEENRPTL